MKRCQSNEKLPDRNQTQKKMGKASPNEITVARNNPEFMSFLIKPHSPRRK